VQLEPATLALTSLCLCASGAAFAPLAVLLCRRIAPGRVVFFARWGFSHALLALLILSAAQWLLALLPRSLLPLPELLIPCLALLAVAAYLYATARRMHPEGWRALGLQAGGTGRALVAGLASLVSCLPLVWGAGLLWSALLELIGESHAPQAVLSLLLGLHGWPLVLALGYAVLLGPLLEELLHRAFLQPLFVQNFGDRGGLVVGSILFAALHPPQVFLGVFALSLVLGSVMLRTQRLAAVWAMHAAYNGLVLALLRLLPESRSLFEL
jgi:membrane protease YdiL (CAAX protease family)